MGCAAIEVASYPIGPHSLTHVALDPMYDMLEEAGRPLVFHVGGGGRLVSPVFAENGREAEIDDREHAPLLPALTSMGIPAPVEMAVAALVLDGVFESHPELMCGVIEQGATWVPGFLRRLDLALHEFGGPTERSRLSLAPSEYVLRQVRFTPFHYEDVSWLIDQSHPDLYLFSTDYPHDEGGTDPLGCFQESLRSRSEEELDRFFRRNFEQLMGAALPQELHG
jgi:predicted TIM-barrel fold metal-dependent hydrolase